jgi:5-methylcytosine-specific restriction endonuclease McrA
VHSNRPRLASTKAPQIRQDSPGVAYVASNGAKRVHALDTRLRGILRPQKWSCYTGGMTPQHSLASLSDAALLAHVGTLAERERHVTAEVIASLAELDARRLYLGAGCSSLFTYCTEVLYLSEHAAYGRIEAARAARRFPLILTRLAEGAVTLTAVCLLAPLLTDDNHERLLEAARHKRKREVELIVAEARPQPAVPSAIRRLPRPTSGRGERVQVTGTTAPVQLSEIAGESGSAFAVRDVPSPPAVQVAPLPPPRPAIVQPLAPERYRVQFTMSREMHDTFRRVQELMRHNVPDGDPAVIFDRALTLLRDHLEKQKLAAAARPRHDERKPRQTTGRSARTRHVPAEVRRAVWARDEGRCAFVGTHGRCTERGFLELHHVEPFAAGGETTAGNLQLRCRSHNAYEATLYFGPSVMREAAATYDRLTRSRPSTSDSVALCPGAG